MPGSRKMGPLVGQLGNGRVRVAAAAATLVTVMLAAAAYMRQPALPDVHGHAANSYTTVQDRLDNFKLHLVCLSSVFKTALSQLLGVVSLFISITMKLVITCPVVSSCSTAHRCAL